MFSNLGTRTIVPVSIFAYCKQNKTVRVSQIDQLGSYRSIGQNGRAGSYNVSTDHGNYTALFENHGKRFGTEQNGGHFHPSENLVGRQRSFLYLSDI